MIGPWLMATITPGFYGMRVFPEKQMSKSDPYANQVKNWRR
jgi:hypothetical protein